MTVNAAVLAIGEWLLAEFEEAVLTREALPAVRTDPGGGSIRPVEYWCVELGTGPTRDGKAGAICVGAIDRARYGQSAGSGFAS